MTDEFGATPHARGNAGATVGVVGAGVIGLSVAWRLGNAGYAVTVLDPHPGRGGSWAAGGMLAPVTEAWPGEEASLRLGEESLRRWPEFARRLTAAGGDPELRTAGTLVAAMDQGDLDSLAVLSDYLGSLGRAATMLSRRDTRQYEPALDPVVRGGLLVPGDLAVDNRRLLAALRNACRALGVRFVGQEALQVEHDTVRTTAATHHYHHVVLAAGAHSCMLHRTLRHAVRPMKGEILRVRARSASLAAPERTLRAVAAGRSVYLVPRSGGTVVVGATQYEAAFDQVVTAGGVRRLLESAERVFPGISEYELVETAAGLRATSNDNLPIIGALPDGVIAATGHHRNGLLLAPVTADAVVDLLRGTEPPGETRAASPDRLSEDEVR